MTIDSQYLRVFCALARHLNMSRAAEELELTPSGISHGLKALEADLGCRLFERTSRKVLLTPAGHGFLADAEGILQSMASARVKLRSWGDWRSGCLRIAASATACQYILPLALREFRESFPDFTIRIDPCSSRQAVEALGDERADLALFIQPTQSVDVQFLPVAEDELHFLVNPLHPWVAKRKANRNEISKQRLILPERSSETHGLIEAFFRAEGIRVEPFIEVGNEEAMKQFVRLGLGIALLPKWIAAAEVRQGLLSSISLGRRKLRRQWGVLHARNHNLTFPESVFVSLCGSVSSALMAGKV